MKKSERQEIDSALDRALQPPKRKPTSELDAILGEYAPKPGTALSQPAMSQPAPGQPVPGLPILDRQPVEQPEGGPVDRRLAVDRQPAVSQPANLIASLPETAGHTELPHRYSDHLAHLLTPDEQAVYTQLYRLAWGWGKETCFITNPRLSERSNVPLSTMKRVVSKLESKGLIEKLQRKFGNHSEQGILYRVLNLSRQPAAGRPTVAHNKKELKESNKVNSEFVLDTKNCPDCQGSGFWYPEGTEKGVAKCRHVRLMEGK